MEIKEVIKNGICVGCGVCSVVDEKNIKMVWNEHGYLQAEIKNNGYNSKKTDSFCPFTSKSMNEDEIAKTSFELSSLKHNSYIGYYDELMAGHVIDEEFRLQGSSGGGVTWLLNELFKKDLIDAVIHVKSSDKSDVLFEYSISKNELELKEGRKSRYYPIELSEVLKKVKDEKLRFAIVGVPCFIKATRNLTLKQPEFEGKIIFFIGIVCGHLKSKHFASLFAWQSGIKPDKLTDIDFRYKYKSNDASLYGVKMQYKGISDNINTETQPSASEMYGTDWGLGFFKYKACDYCDDIFGECADVVFGDAWVEGFREDWRGDNIVISRSEKITKILTEGISNSEIQFQKVSEDLINSTQKGSIRHRRIGLAYRLFLDQVAGTWTPNKRIVKFNGKIEKYHLRQNERIWFRDNVNEIFMDSIKKNSFFYFKKKLFFKVLMYKYNTYGWKSIIPRKLKKIFRNIFKSIK